MSDFGFAISAMDSMTDVRGGERIGPVHGGDGIVAILRQYGFCDIQQGRFIVHEQDQLTVSVKVRS